MSFDKLPMKVNALPIYNGALPLHRKPKRVPQIFFGYAASVAPSLRTVLNGFALIHQRKDFFFSALIKSDEPNYIECDNPNGFKYQSPLAASSVLSPNPSPQHSPSASSPSLSSTSNRGSSSSTGPTSPSRLGSPGGYFCQICAKKFNSDKTFNAHLASAAHQSRMRQASAPTSSKGRKNQRGDDPEANSNDENSDEDSYSSSGSVESTRDDEDDDKDENLARAVTMAQSATRILQSLSGSKQAINISELDKAYKLFLQAAKLYNQIWHLRDAVKCYSHVVDIQKQLLAAKLNPGASSSKLSQSAAKNSTSLYDIVKARSTSSSIDGSLLGHAMVLLKVNLYVGRLLRSIQPLQSLQYFEATLERIIGFGSLPDLSASSPASPSAIREWGHSVADFLSHVISFVDEQRSSAAGAAAVAFGPELLGIVAECSSYICALDTSIKGALRVLCYLGLYEALRNKISTPQTFPLDLLWHVKYLAQIYASLGCYWWSSDMWIECWRISAEVHFLDYGVLAAILCDDLVRMKRLLSLEGVGQASATWPLLRQICTLRLSGSPDAWEEFQFQWNFVKNDIMASTKQDNIASQAFRDQILFQLEEKFDLASKKS